MCCETSWTGEPEGACGAVTLDGAVVPVGGKTGTTNGFRNAAFLGFVPRATEEGWQAAGGVVIASYVGYDDNRSMRRGDCDSQVHGPLPPGRRSPGGGGCWTDRRSGTRRFGGCRKVLRVPVVAQGGCAAPETETEGRTVLVHGDGSDASGLSPSLVGLCFHPAVLRAVGSVCSDGSPTEEPGTEAEPVDDAEIRNVWIEEMGDAGIEPGPTRGEPEVDSEAVPNLEMMEGETVSPRIGASLMRMQGRPRRLAVRRMRSHRARRIRMLSRSRHRRTSEPGVCRSRISTRASRRADGSLARVDRLAAVHGTSDATPLALPSCRRVRGPGRAFRGVADAPLPPPVDFGEVDQRLDALLAAPDDVDQRDRLQAALVLARKAKTDDAATQRVVLGYLQQVVAIEERSRSYSAPVLPSVPRVESFDPIGADLVVEEPLDALGRFRMMSGL